MYEFPVYDYNTNGVCVCHIGPQVPPLSLAQVEVFGTGELGMTSDRLSINQCDEIRFLDCLWLMFLITVEPTRGTMILTA